MMACDLKFCLKNEQQAFKSLEIYNIEYIGSINDEMYSIKPQ